MTVVTEGRHAGEHLISEGNGHVSRDAIVVASGADLDPGTVLGQILRGAASAAAKSGGNTGNGALGAITFSALAQPGVYKLRITAASTNAGAYQVVDPQGDVVGIGNVGAAFSGGGLAFTLADGATDFIVGDGFDITVAKGSEKFKALDPSATDGTQIAAGILFGHAHAAAEDVDAVAHRRQCEVNAAELTWPAGISGAAKSDAIKQLAERGIILR